MARNATSGILAQVQIGTTITDSRLDDELSVAIIEFSDTPPWLVDPDPRSFPKHTSLGTIWRGVDRTAITRDGLTAYIQAVIDGGSQLGLCYAEMLAEFPDTNVNVQDKQGRTALHWACAMALPEMVRLCLSVPDCQIGLRDDKGLTAFDISRNSGNDIIPAMFYHSMFELEERDPQVALLRILTVTADPAHETNKPVFPGQAIFDPVKDRNSPLVIALLDRGIDLTAKDEDGSTALHVAAAMVGNAVIAKKLLDAGSEISALADGGATPLHFAAGSADTDMVQLLLDWNADVAAANTKGESALHLAAQNGQLDVAKLLVCHGAYIGAKDNLGRTPLHLAESNERVDIVRLLKGAGELNRPVELAELVRMEAEDLPPQDQWLGDLELRNEEDLTPLLQAAMEGNLAIVGELLDRGANTESTYKLNRTSLHLAAMNGHSMIIKALLAAGAQVHAKCHAPGPGPTKFRPQQKALHLAARGGHTETVNALLDGGAEINEADVSSIMYPSHAVDDRHSGIVINSIESREVGRCYSVKRTPLHYAAANGFTRTVEVLLARGANVNEHDGCDQTILQVAARNGHVETVTALLAGGATIETRMLEGKTAYQLALANGHAGVVQELVNAGAHTTSVGRFPSSMINRLRKS